MEYQSNGCDGRPMLPTGEDGGLSTDAFENINAKPGEKWESAADVNKAIADLGGMRTAASSSILSEGPAPLLKGDQYE